MFAGSCGAARKMRFCKIVSLQFFEEVGMRTSRRNATTVPSAASGSSSSSTNPKRRNFLLALGAGGAGAAALAARSITGVVTDAAASEATEEGYRVTDHVKRYYETTKT